MVDFSQRSAPMTTLTEGSIAPDFSLTSDNGETLRLSSIKGKNVVLYFYPKDDTPGCTIEAKNFADALPEFTAANTVILGISKDNTTSHIAFKTKYCLPFTLLSDAEGSVCATYGTWIQKSMFGRKYMGIDRATFLIDKNSIIQKIWRKVSVSGHVNAVLAAAKTL
jgi:peroxiredoxin Q/BCP